MTKVSKTCHDFTVIANLPEEFAPGLVPWVPGAWQTPSIIIKIGPVVALLI
jgi:hypothetical protein